MRPEIKGPGPGLGPTRLPQRVAGYCRTPPCRASRGTSECYASGVGPTVTRYTLGESSRTQPWPWPLNLCQIVPHHVMLCWSDSGPSCRTSCFIYTRKPITEVKQRRVWLVLGWCSRPRFRELTSLAAPIELVPRSAHRWLPDPHLHL